MKRRGGFTLIELLVVIAIIGILSAVVLAALSTARSKGYDAAIQSDLSTVQTQAEIYYSSNGNSYGLLATGNCPLPGASGSSVFHDPVVERATKAANDANGSGSVFCNAGSTWAMQAALVAGVGDKMFWCVDSGGVAKAQTTAWSPSAGTYDCAAN